MPIVISFLSFLLASYYPHYLRIRLNALFFAQMPIIFDVKSWILDLLQK